MLRETVASTESPTPSFTLKVNESPPVAFAVGVYTKFGAVPLKAPLVGPVTTVNFSVAPSTSVPASTIALAVSSSVVTDCATATGAELAGTIEINTTSSAELAKPSLARKLN